MKQRVQLGDSVSWYDPMLLRDRSGVAIEVGTRVAIVRDEQGRSESVPLFHLSVQNEAAVLLDQCAWEAARRASYGSPEHERQFVHGFKAAAGSGGLLVGDGASAAMVEGFNAGLLHRQRERRQA